MRVFVSLFLVTRMDMLMGSMVAGTMLMIVF